MGEDKLWKIRGGGGGGESLRECEGMGMFAVSGGHPLSTVQGFLRGCTEHRFVSNIPPSPPSPTKRGRSGNFAHMVGSVSHFTRNHELFKAFSSGRNRTTV